MITGGMTMIAGLTMRGTAMSDTHLPDTTLTIDLATPMTSTSAATTMMTIAAGTTMTGTATPTTGSPRRRSG
jgi:hypothetical protein